MTKYEKLLKTGRIIFNVDDLMVIWQDSNRRVVLESIKGYIERGKIFPIFKGIYSIKSDYNQFELGQKLFTPSYISYYSALAYHGIIFQKYGTIHLFATQSKKIEVNGQDYIFHKVREDILLNTAGIVKDNNFTISSPERAVADSLYINHEIAFDNLSNLDKNKLSKLSSIYNKRVESDIKKLIEEI